MNNRKKYCLIFVMLIGIIATMFLLWKVKIGTYSMPIQHKVQYSGEFEVSVGEIREIVIQHPKLDKKVQIEIVVNDNLGNVWYKEKFDNVEFKGVRQTLDKFEKGSGLKFEKGTYFAKVYFDGQEKKADVRFIEYSGSLKKMYTTLCVLLLVALAVFYVINYEIKISLEVTYIITALMLGIIYNFVMPPLGVPDEQSHFMEAYSLSSKMLFQEKYSEDGTLMIREEDYDSILYLHTAASIAEWYDSFDFIGENDLVASDYNSTVVSKSAHAYVASAVGISVARIFNLSGHLLLIMGRMFNLLVMAVLTALAIKITPYGKEFFFVLGSMPEVIYLFTSYSYDGANLALCMLAVAIFLRLYMKEENITLKEILILAIVIILMLPIKVVYIVYLALILMLPWHKIDITAKKKKILTCSLVVGCVLFAIVSIPLILPLLNGIGQGTSDGISLSYIWDNKMKTLQVYINTILGETDYYLFSALGEITGRGRYSGLDYLTMPNWLQVIVIVLMLVSLEDTKENRLSNFKRIACIFMGIFTYMAVLTSMYFAFTNPASDRIMGVQGRYLLPIFVLLPLIVKNNVFKIEKGKKEICVIGITWTNLIFVSLIFFYYMTNYFSL